jgi:uncharacterized protein (TIGR03083 family)
MLDVRRQDALGTLREGEAQVQELLRGLTPEQMTKPATIGGGDWSAKDLVGHIAFWEELALSTLTVWSRGAEPDMVGAVDEVNAANHVRKAKWSLERVLAERQEVHDRLMQEIEALSDREWTAAPPKSFARRETLGARLGGLTGAADGQFRHAFAHVDDLRAYVESLA